MKLALRRLRLGLVRQVMEIMVRLAHVFQLGHPHWSAPKLRPRPAAGETLGTYEGGCVYSFPDGISAAETGGVAISGRNEYFDNLTHYFRGARLHPAVVRLKVKRPPRLAGTGAHLCTPQARGNYYHWMVDLIPRLWLLEQAELTPGTIDHVFVNGDGLPWELDPLLAHGFLPEQIRFCAERDRYQVDRLVVPDQVGDELHFAAWKARFLRRLFPLSTETAARRLFCGRKGSAWRRLLNEDELFARLQPLGFERVPAGLPVPEQARLFSEAGIVVAVHGAALTNIVFAPHTAVLFDIQSRESPQTFFSSICTATSVRHNVIAAEPTRRGTDPVDLNRVDTTLSPAQIDALVACVEKELAAPRHGS